MTYNVQCPKCCGEGGEWIDECEGMGPLSWHACYHCGEEGVLRFVTHQSYKQYINELADEAALLDKFEAIVDGVHYEDVPY